MISPATIAILTGFLVHRGLISFLPYFTGNLALSPITNLTCGLTSDLFSLGVLLLPVAVYHIWRPRLPIACQALAKVLGIATAAAIVVFLAIHIRYVEHFGTNLRPLHIAAMTTGDAWWAGTGMVLESWRACCLLGLSGLAAGVAQLFNAKLAPRTDEPKAFLRHTAALILILPLLNGAVIQLRTGANVHSEFRYNPLQALYFNFRDPSTKPLPLPSVSERSYIRKMLPGRSFLSDEYPLWQKEIFAEPTANPTARSFVDQLRQFLHSRSPQWNVLIVMLESFRAQELSGFGSRQGLTPHLATLMQESIVFNEAIGSSQYTHGGQSATFCSLYGIGTASLLTVAPSTRARCLGEIFRERGYSTHFFYGSDNHFDNQHIFYPFHRIETIMGEEAFGKSAPKAGWGFSDHALFGKTFERLETATAPFFATVLSLSNHGPWKLPEDAPEHIQNLPVTIQMKLIAYVDWALAHFYKKITATFPNTLIFTVADHGIFRGEAVGAHPDYTVIRRVLRIPWLITIPGLPPELAKRIDHQVSDVDIPPTLLSLLGWNLPQQFNGEVAFYRRSPIYASWQSDFLEIGPQHNISSVPVKLRQLAISLMQYNLIAPKGF